ncbi:unnamed protein product [Pleuronectes platessa]|uniref:Uncharacterized protein n=1 Tax=Pleuronectes platessa TaxID=8262 RepID=A0A9N7YTF7_PLEPL|nr:unnamed protein product [Pleuronectes platessa]
MGKLETDLLHEAPVSDRPFSRCVHVNITKPPCVRFPHAGPPTCRIHVSVRATKGPGPPAACSGHVRPCGGGLAHRQTDSLSLNPQDSHCDLLTPPPPTPCTDHDKPSELHTAGSPERFQIILAAPPTPDPRPLSSTSTSALHSLQAIRGTALIRLASRWHPPKKPNGSIRTNAAAVSSARLHHNKPPAVFSSSRFYPEVVSENGFSEDTHRRNAFASPSPSP